MSLVSAVMLTAAEDGGEFEPPTVEHSFFFDRVAEGEVVSSVKAMVLLGLGVILIMAFYLAASRKTAVVPGKMQFAGESAYGFAGGSVFEERPTHRANLRWRSNPGS